MAPARQMAIHPSVQEAEMRCWKQRRELVKLIQVDKKKAANPADLALCERVRAAAMDDFAEFENLLTFPEVNALFCRGALHFNQPARKRR